VLAYNGAVPFGAEEGIQFGEELMGRLFVHRGRVPAAARPFGFSFCGFEVVHPLFGQSLDGVPRSTPRASYFRITDSTGCGVVMGSA
jgi:hypothetical protein